MFKLYLACALVAIGGNVSAKEQCQFHIDNNERIEDIQLGHEQPIYRSYTFNFIGYCEENEIIGLQATHLIPNYATSSHISFRLEWESVLLDGYPITLQPHVVREEQKENTFFIYRGSKHVGGRHIHGKVTVTMEGDYLGAGKEVLQLNSRLSLIKRSLPKAK